MKTDNIVDDRIAQWVYLAPPYKRIAKKRPNHQMPVEVKQLRVFGCRGIWNNERFWWWNLRPIQSDKRKRLPYKISR